ncbi:MAG: ROK family transcriptional regulator [Pseudothermotoga sp.]|nr:ROK family transcriptional regulator [Pseudothermotoga sp.]
MLTGLESSILKIIVENEGISRQQIAQKLGITKPVVSNVVAQLMDKGLVVESGKTKIQNGRPRVRLSFVKNAWYCVGLELDENFFEVVISDLLGNVVDSIEERIPPYRNFDQLVDWCCKKANEVLSRNFIFKDKLLGVGIGIAGMVDPKTGMVRTAPAFGIKNVDVASMFAQRLNANVIVMNRVRAAAFTECRIGIAKGLEKAVFVFFDSGLGSALLIDGKFYEGFFGKAGEFGWLITDPFKKSEEIFHEPNFGYLARKISGHGFKELSKKLGTNIEEIFSQDRGMLKEILDKGLKHLAIALANVLLIFDPQAVIIKGRLGQKYFDRITKVIVPTLKDFLPEQFYENLDIRCGIVEKFDVALGAAFMVRQKVMNI